MLVVRLAHFSELPRALSYTLVQDNTQLRHHVLPTYDYRDEK